MADPKPAAKNQDPPADPPAEPGGGEGGDETARTEAKALMKEAWSEWLEENKEASDDRNRPSTGLDLFKKIVGI